MVGRILEIRSFSSQTEQIGTIRTFSVVVDLTPTGSFSVEADRVDGGQNEEVAVPLSEHEQKLLEQMERALYAEDPKFATQMKGSHRGAVGGRRAGIGIAIAVLGLGLVIAGVSLPLVWLGGIGFAVMVAGVAWALTPSRGAKETQGASRATSAKSSRTRRRPLRQGKRGGSSSFMQRMEGRWEERRRSQGR